MAIVVGMPFAADPRPDVVKLSTPADVVLAIPHLLGFHPEQSIVMLSLRGPRGRVGLSVRFDLLPESEDETVAAMLAERMACDGAAQVFVAVYTSATDGPGAELPRWRLVESVMKACTAPVRDAVLVRDGRWRSYLCAEPACCPTGGQLLDPESSGALAMAAAQAVHGRAVLADREAVVASVAPVTGIAAVSMLDAIGRASDELGLVGWPEFCADARSLLAALLDRYDAPPATATDDEIARLVVAFHDIALRDDALCLTAERGEAFRPLLHDLARRSLPPWDAPVCTVLAWQAYSDGEGVVAGAALDRALRSNGGYRMALLLRDALERQMPPQELRRVTRGQRRSPPARRR